MKITATRVFDGYRFLPGETVIVTDGEGVITDILPRQEAGEDVQVMEGILSPGFVNCHCHLELSHLKGQIPERTGLAAFVAAVMKQRQMPVEIMTESIARAEEEMVANGIVAVGDICNAATTIPQKLKGKIWYHNFIEGIGFNDEVAEGRFRRCIDLFTAFAQLYSIPIESISIVPHAPYSVSPELWKRLINFPGNHLLTIHNQESEEEEEWFRSGTGELLRFFQSLGLNTSGFQPPGSSGPRNFLPGLLRNQSLILVHNVFTSESDIGIAGDSGLDISWCLCPNANLYITGRLPDVDMFLRNDCRLVLGTDSLASNHSLDILGEMRTLRSHFPKIAVDQLLRWATSNGARTLRMDQLLGSFEKGKRPGLLLLDEDLSKVRRLQ